MDQQQLAEAIGIESASMSQIETGVTKMPRPTTLLKLAAVLETNMPWLLLGDGSPSGRDMVVSDAVAIKQLENLAPEHKAAIKAMIQTFRAMEKKT